MRTTILVVVALLVLVLAALLILPHFVNVNAYHGQITAQLQQRINRPVKLGQMSLSLLPPKFKVDQASIGEDPRFGNGSFAVIDQLAIRLKFWPLLRKKVEISGLDLQRPRIELIRNAQGVWNYSTLGKPAGQQAPSSPSAPAQTLELDSLKVSDGQVAVTDFQKGQPRAVYDHIDANLKNFAPDKPFDLSLSARLPGQGSQTISLNGVAGPISRDNIVDTPADGTLSLNNVSLASVQSFVKARALTGLNGVVSGKANVKNKDGSYSSSGSLRVKDPVVRGTNLGFPISVDYMVGGNEENNTVYLTKATVHLGSAPVVVSGTVNTGSTPPQVDLKLKAQDVPLEDIARLADASGKPLSGNIKTKGSASANLTAQGQMNRPAMNGTASLRDLEVSGSDIPAPVNVPAVDLTLTPQQVRSNDFTATAGKTSLGANFVLTNYTTPSPLVNGSVNTTNAQLADLLSMARAYGLSAAKDVTGSGLATLHVQAAGPIENVGAMNITGNGQLQNASFHSPNLKAPLNVHRADLNFSGNAAQVSNLAASVGQSDAAGTITVRNFAAPNVQFALTSNKIDLTELQQLHSPARPAPSKNAGFSLLPSAYAAVSPRSSTAASPSLAAVTGGGTLQAATLQMDQLTMTNVHATVALNRGVINVSPLTAQLYGGTQNGTIVLDARTEPVTIQAHTNLQRVDANQLLSAVSSVKNSVYGLLAANTQLTFQAANAQDVERTLNGTAALNLTNGKIAKLDLLNELASVGKLAGVRQNPQAVTDVAKMAGHFNIINGLASTKDLTANIANGTVAGNGTINLVSQELAMHLTAVLSKGFTQQIAPSGIGGLMQTALANKQGELVIPVLLTGTFDHPKVSPDAEKVAQMKLQNLLPTTGNPAALTSSLPGLLKGGKGGAGQVPAGLGGFLGSGNSQNPASTGQGQPAQNPNPQQEIPKAFQGILGGNK